jgi:signal transduction histidine kinase
MPVPEGDHESPEMELRRLRLLVANLEDENRQLRAAATSPPHDPSRLTDAGEGARREAKRQQARQLESLGVLAEGIAHAFNNILTATLGYAGLAAAHVADGSPARDHLREIEDSAHRAARLCQRMLAFAGKGMGLAEPTDLAALVHETARQLSPSLARNADVGLNLPAGLPPVVADPAQLRQAAAALLVNASEALPDGAGKISVAARTERLTRDRLAELRLGEELPEGEYVLLEVADTGVGMDDATKERLFEPFFSTKFLGRGLGLPAVLGTMRRHRGALEVLSRPGAGSTFRLWFPRAAEAAREAAD